MIIEDISFQMKLEDEIQRAIESGFEGVPSPIGKDTWKIKYRSRSFRRIYRIC